MSTSRVMTLSVCPAWHRSMVELALRPYACKQRSLSFGMTVIWLVMYKRPTMSSSWRHGEDFFRKTYFFKFLNSLSPFWGKSVAQMGLRTLTYNQRLPTFGMTVILYFTQKRRQMWSSWRHDDVLFFQTKFFSSMWPETTQGGYRYNLWRY